MLLTGLLPDITTDPAIETAVDPVEAGRSDTIVTSVGIRPPPLTAIAPRAATLLVVLTATGRDAESLTNALASWAPNVAILPAWKTLPHERLSSQVSTMVCRIAALRRLVHLITGDDSTGPMSALVIPICAFPQPIISGPVGLGPMCARTGDIPDLTGTMSRLAGLSYERVDVVEGRDQVSVCGGTLDVFPPQESHPLCVELWEDEIDGIRAFSVSDQRTPGEAADGLWAIPCRESPLTRTIRARARGVADCLPDAAEMFSPATEGITTPGIGFLAPILIGDIEPLLDLLPTGSPILVSDPERTRTRVADLVAAVEEFLTATWSAAAGGAGIPLEAPEAPLLDLTDLWGSGNHPWWRLIGLSPADLASAIDEAEAGSPSMDSPAPVVISSILMRVGARDVHPCCGDFAWAAVDLIDLARDGRRIVITTEGLDPGRHIRFILIGVSYPAALTDNVEARLGPGLVIIMTVQASIGSVTPRPKVAILAEGDLAGRAGAFARDMRRMPPRRRKSVDPLTLHPGNYTVRDQHSIGRFIELVSRTVGREDAVSTRDHLVIECAPSKRGQPADRLFVPTDTLNQISRHTGSDDPSLTKMGGADWTKTKARTKKAVNEVAKELIRLYIVHQQIKGHTFSPDTPWQRELEDAFPYVETPDQLVTTDKIKVNMEKPVPMDRLLTGDIDYSKAEIAVHVAFKAIQDGYQVAALVPTTLLVTRHVETSAKRCVGLPVCIGTLLCFSTPKEAEEIKVGPAPSEVDLIIDTRSLLTDTVSPKKLGLVIIDKEQHFGVEHKETLKALRTDVDVLLMSVTPIPRTFEITTSGIREMSIPQTPPEERRPVLTFIGAYTDAQVSATIRHEFLCDGQVFYVHNRADLISSVTTHITGLVSEVRVRTAHGKMSEHQLKAVTQDFWNHEFDVLVCTTIVETGPDISNANTFITNRADTLGLSQLHQLRGRIGRGHERAYAYFLYPGDKALTEIAHEHLETIAASTELGAGLAVAQCDLEIRGVGNLLGEVQSDHVEGVGFDLYVWMIFDAVAAYQGSAPTEKTDVRMDLQVDACIPDGYVRKEHLRLEVYAKIAAISTPEQEADVCEELIDQYGPIPPQVDLLFAVARLREIVRRAGITEAVMQGKCLRVSPVELRNSQVMHLKRLHPETVIKIAIRQVLVPPSLTSRVGGSPLTDGPLLEWVKILVIRILVLFGEQCLWWDTPVLLRCNISEEGMLVRHTRQLATTALIVTVRLGMGACSAHPGVTIVTDNGSYSIAKADEAVSRIAAVTGGQFSIGAYQIRASLMNELQLVAVADSVGISITDGQIDQTIKQIATQTGAQVLVIGRGTRAIMRSLLLDQQLNQVTQVNPGVMSTMSEAFEQTRTATNARINPRFSQPTLGGGQAPITPLFGGAVSGAKDDPTAALLGGSAQ